MIGIRLSLGGGGAGVVVFWIRERLFSLLEKRFLNAKSIGICEKEGERWGFLTLLKRSPSADRQLPSLPSCSPTGKSRDGFILTRVLESGSPS